MKYLPGKHKEFSKKIYDVKNFILEKVKEHQETLDPDNPRDYIDCFLTKMEQVLYAAGLFPWYYILSLLKMQKNIIILHR